MLGSGRLFVEERRNKGSVAEENLTFKTPEDSREMVQLNQGRQEEA